jgi:hypothetical protein
MKPNKRDLILHVDINKTILIQDPYDHLPTSDDVCYSLIAERAWGHLEEHVEEIAPDAPSAEAVEPPKEEPKGKGKKGKQKEPDPPVEEEKPKVEVEVEKVVTYSFKLTH